MKTTNETRKAQRYSVNDFRKQFGNDDVCLEWLKDSLFPDGVFCKPCGKITTHHRVTSRKSYSCQFCGHHVHPTAGTIYHKSTTPLTDWFYAVYLMSSTRCGISAKQLERELDVTYKTAWRMFKLIRTMLDESDEKIGGDGTKVEIDETWVGGKGHGAFHRDFKSTVVGAVERDGEIIAKVVPDVTKASLIPFIKDHVETGSHLFTDEHAPYTPLRHHGYSHQRIQHKSKVWVRGDVHTNTIEGFWSLMKGGIRGVYKGRPTAKHLQDYVNEYAFRYNRRHVASPMFFEMLNQTAKLVG